MMIVEVIFAILAPVAFLLAVLLMGVAAYANDTHDKDFFLILAIILLFVTSFIFFPTIGVVYGGMAGLLVIGTVTIPFLLGKLFIEFANRMSDELSDST